MLMAMLNFCIYLLRQGGASLATERSEEERSGAKPRGRGLGQRNTGIYFCLYIKSWQILLLLF